MQTDDLAIVIPAFRARFLVPALASLARQTDRRFRVYVGDDASPDDIEGLCAQWSSSLDLAYTRFATNAGGSDLVAQWARCIALSTEPWVWLFSDDDVIDTGCVAAWRYSLGQHPDADLFHFDVTRIDADGAVIQDEPSFPDRLSPRQFLLERFQFQLASYAPDYVFSRRAYEAVQGFERFPLAWCSDDATWIKMAALGGGIRAVRGAKVFWRASGLNISSYADRRLAMRKLEAWVQFLEWLDARLPVLPAETGDPDDQTLMEWGRHWLYQQAGIARIRFRQTEWLTLAHRLSRLRAHGAVGTLLRMIRSDFMNRHIT